MVYAYFHLLEIGLRAYLSKFLFCSESDEGSCLTVHNFFINLLRKLNLAQIVEQEKVNLTKLFLKEVSFSFCYKKTDNDFFNVLTAKVYEAMFYFL